MKHTKKNLFKKIKYYALSKACGFKISFHRAELGMPQTCLKSTPLKIEEPQWNELNRTYVMVRNLNFAHKINLNRINKFEHILKWRHMREEFSVVLRNYPLGLCASTKNLEKEKIRLNISKKVKNFEQKILNISKNIKITEEITQIQPYTREFNRQKLFKLPISRSPIFKSYLPESEMKKLREELAKQNKTRWSNVEILEIYDKLNIKLFSDIRQTSASRNLLLYPNATNVTNVTNAAANGEENLYYLIIGKKRDTGEVIKALSNMN